MPRLFLAIDLPPHARSALAALGAELPGIRWVAAAQLHVTLRFLGEVPAEAAVTAAVALEGVAAAPFPVALAGVGVFPPRPGRQPPRVLWAGIAPAAPAVALKAAIDGVLGPDLEAGARAFTPHVTLARLKGNPGAGKEGTIHTPRHLSAALVSFLDRHRPLSSASWTVEAFHLYESRTLPEGAVYTRLRTYPLRARAATCG
jgi:2'-5' RNA ligase